MSAQMDARTQQPKGQIEDTDRYGAVSKTVRRMTARLKKNKQMQKAAEEVANCLFDQTPCNP